MAGILGGSSYNLFSNFSIPGVKSAASGTSAPAIAAAPAGGTDSRLLNPQRTPAEIAQMQANPVNNPFNSATQQQAYQTELAKKPNPFAVTSSGVAVDKGDTARILGQREADRQISEAATQAQQAAALQRASDAGNAAAAEEAAAHAPVSGEQTPEQKARAIALAGQAEYMTPEAIAQRKANETPITSDLTVDQPTETPTDAAGNTNFDLARQQIDAKFERMKQQKLEALKGRLAAMGLSGGGIELEQMRQAEAEMDAQKGAEISAITQQELEQGFKAGESAMDRALTKMGLTIQEKQLANQASQFKSEMEFKTWAEQNNVDANTAARAWDQQKTAMGIASEEKMQGVSIKGQQDLATLQSNLGVAADMQKTQNELMVNTWFGIGQSGQTLTTEQQATLDSNPAAKLAYEGGKAGKTLADIKTQQESITKYLDARIENLGAMTDASGRPISGTQFSNELKSVYRELGMQIPGETQTIIDKIGGADYADYQWSTPTITAAAPVVVSGFNIDKSKLPATSGYGQMLSTPDASGASTMIGVDTGRLNTLRTQINSGAVQPVNYASQTDFAASGELPNNYSVVTFGNDITPYVSLGPDPMIMRSGGMSSLNMTEIPLKFVNLNDGSILYIGRQG